MQWVAWLLLNTESGSTGKRAGHQSGGGEVGAFREMITTRVTLQVATRV